MLPRPLHPFLATLIMTTAFADGPADNQVDAVRPVPPPGVSLEPAAQTQLEEKATALGQALDRLRNNPTLSPESRSALPDVEVFYKAVRDALDYDEFYQPEKEVPAALQLLEEGLTRAAALATGQIPWNQQTGLVVRGYRSRIDGSVQPYGLVIPETMDVSSPDRRRLDTWFHGRGEKLTELNFIRQRLKTPGEFAPKDAIVIHLYGRYCNANKFAGEVDLFEALDDVKSHYRIDENRMVVRGFSMGGAACWQFATHFAGMWAAAAPSAGFSETPEFLRSFQKETLDPTWYERKLWHWYDATDYALNLFNCPTVAYSGEIDRQKQAADIMAEALAREGMTLTHIIGPETGHRYHPEAKEEIDRQIDRLTARDRNPIPSTLKFVTFTLRYSRMRWIQLHGLEAHWERAQVDAEILDAQTIELKTTNISDLSIVMAPGLCPLDQTLAPTVIIDGQDLQPPGILTDRSWNPRFVKRNRRWEVADSNDPPGLFKRPGLQGPIDDAFMDRFMMVTPTGRPLNPVIASWTAREQQHAITHWRSQFRGRPRIKMDGEITLEDIRDHHLILWGDPSSNSLLRRITQALPIRWTREGVTTPERVYPADRFVPVLIYPNPLNPKRYIVINSGFTFREYDYLNNARQVAKLPDWAIIDFTSPLTSQHAGEVTQAGFFDERWQWKPNPQH